jgi:hypothetical protein
VFSIVHGRKAPRASAARANQTPQSGEAYA